MPNRRMVPIVHAGSNKAQEKAALQAMASACEPNSYLASLFTPDFVALVGRMMDLDELPDFEATYTSQRVSLAETRASLAAEHDRANRHHASFMDALRNIQVLEDRLQEAGQLNRELVKKLQERTRDWQDLVPRLQAAEEALAEAQPAIKGWAALQSLRETLLADLDKAAAPASLMPIQVLCTRCGQVATCSDYQEAWLEDGCHATEAGYYVANPDQEDSWLVCDDCKEMMVERMTKHMLGA